MTLTDREKEGRREKGRKEREREKLGRRRLRGYIPRLYPVPHEDRPRCPPPPSRRTLDVVHPRDLPSLFAFQGY